MFDGNLNHTHGIWHASAGNLLIVRDNNNQGKVAENATVTLDFIQKPLYVRTVFVTKRWDFYTTGELCYTKFGEKIFRKSRNPLLDRSVLASTNHQRSANYLYR